MTVRTLILLWLAALWGAMLASGWWALGVFRFKPYTELVNGEWNWKGCVAAPTVLLTAFGLFALVVSVQRLLDEDK